MNNLKPYGRGGSAQEEAGYVFTTVFPDIASQMIFFVNLTVILTGWATCGIEVFMRYKFGVRYMNPLRVLFGFVMLNVLLLMMGYRVTYYSYAFNAFEWAMVMIRSNPLVLGYVVVSACHLILDWWQMRHGGQPWHTRSFGQSGLVWILRQMFIQAPWLDREWLFYRLIDPSAILVIGLLTRENSPVFGNWMMLMACLLWLRANLIYTQMLNALYDRQDALIEATFWQEAIKGQPSNKTAGFAIVRGVPGLSAMMPSAKASDIKSTVAQTMKPPSDQRNPPSGN